jgi:hypothetical protein
MVDTLDLKSRLAKLRLAGVKQDQHVKRKIQDDNEWEDIKRESYEEPQPAYPEEIEAAEEQRKSLHGKKKKKSIKEINKDAMDHNKAQDELDYESFR